MTSRIPDADERAAYVRAANDLALDRALVALALTAAAHRANERAALPLATADERDHAERLARLATEAESDAYDCETYARIAGQEFDLKSVELATR